MLIGNLNREPTETAVLDLYNLTNLVKYKACFKNPSKPSHIDLTF